MSSVVISWHRCFNCLCFSSSDVLTQVLVSKGKQMLRVTSPVIRRWRSLRCAAFSDGLKPPTAMFGGLVTLIQTHQHREHVG